MSQVFVSYRRDDSADVTGRICDRLVQKFGRPHVFRDVDSIPLGVDFRRVIDKAVGRCQVLLVVIGPQWLRAASQNGERRLDDPDDFVRLEIEAALERGIPVIPVMASGAAMPSADQLPPSLHQLAFRNGIAVRRDPDFDHDMARLMSRLDKLLKGETSPSAQPPKAQAGSQQLAKSPAKPAPRPQSEDEDDRRRAPRATAATAAPPKKRRVGRWVLLAGAVAVLMLGALAGIALMLSGDRADTGRQTGSSPPTPQTGSPLPTALATPRRVSTEINEYRIEVVSCELRGRVLTCKLTFKNLRAGGGRARRLLVRGPTTITFDDGTTLKLPQTASQGRGALSRNSRPFPFVGRNRAKNGNRPRQWG